MRQGIKVDYVYSACVVISTPDCRILCDPWFTEGIYDGSWHHYPKVAHPIEKIGDCDAIYISHIHPDHYDATFIKQYFQTHGPKPLWIADHQPNHLRGKMRADKLIAEILTEPKKIADTEIEIVPHRTGSVADIDSALVVRYWDGRRQHVVANVNDIVFDDEILQTLKERCPEIDILLLGYTGAGPYPQTYFDLDDPRLISEANLKKQGFFSRYKKTVAALNPKTTLPFAGKYVLGGKLAHLNSYRGVADATEVLRFDPRAVVLADDDGSIDTVEYRPTQVRVEPYDSAALEAYLKQIAGCALDYERLISAEEIRQLPIKRLLSTAFANARTKSEVAEDYYFAFHLPDGEVAVLNANRKSGDGMTVTNQEKLQQLVPRSEIRIDPRYLFGLLTNVYHWNNAEVGSQFYTRRFPATAFNRQAQSFLNFLAV